MVEYGTRTIGAVTQIDPDSQLFTDTVYETRHIYDKEIHSWLELSIKNEIYDRLTAQGAKVLYIKVSGNEVITQFIYPTGSLAIPLVGWIVLGIIATGILIFAVGFVLVAQTISKVSPALVGPSLMAVGIGIALIGGALFLKYLLPAVKEYYPPPAVAGR